MDAWDYDDSLVWAVWSHSGVVYTFSHSGSMHGWADLCAGWSWHAVAGVNFDIGSLVNDLEKIIGAVTTIGKIIAIVA